MNMWFAVSTDDVEKYMSLGLNDLIAKPDGSHKITFKKEPMLFLLCLLDTIDPIKAYSTNCPETVARAIRLESEKVNDKLRIVLDDCIDSETIKRAQNCDAWLNVSVQTYTTSSSGIDFYINE